MPWSPGIDGFSASEKPGICQRRCRPRCPRKKKTKRILFALRMMLPLESIGFYWFGFRNFMVCFFEKKQHLDAKSHIFSTWFSTRFTSPLCCLLQGPFAKANGSRTASCRPSEGVGLQLVFVKGCKIPQVECRHFGMGKDEYQIYMIYDIYHLSSIILYIYTVHMFFQNEVIGSSSWLMLVFRIGEPFQNSLDIRKKLIMSAADSHKHKHVKHSKRTLWVTCFFLVAFLNCLPFPKSRSIRTSGTSSRERACPRACWILAFLQSQLWARRCLEKSRLFLLTQIIT